MKREDKIAFIQAKQIERWRDKEIRQHIGVPERTYFRWKKRIQEDYTALVNKKKPGPKPRFHIDAVTSRKIQSWRKTYGWGPGKMEGHLDVHHKTHIPHNRIHQLFKQKGLNKPIGKPRKMWGKKRWERKHAMSLWQGDWKDTNSDNRIPMMTFYDDRSRFVVASKRFLHATTENSIKLLEKAFRKYGKPEQILTDSGTQFRNNHKEGGLCVFEQFCMDSGVEVIHSTKQRPTTCGKIENFHGCYDAEVWVTKGDHAKFMRYWNHKRPCGAIGYLYPVEVFYSARKEKTAINSG
jgi:putative transposase